MKAGSTKLGCRISTACRSGRFLSTPKLARPSSGQENGTVSVFSVDGDGIASRRQVKLGKGSVRHIQVVEGLRQGERVILSDMSAWDQVDRLQIK